MKPIIKAFVLIILCVAVAGAAEKKRSTDRTSTEDPFKKEFKQCDTNHDGYINLAEWKAAGKDEATFKAKDKNRDGKLSFAEFKTETSAGGTQEVRKYTRQAADQQLRRLKKLLEDGLLTKDMYDRKVAECEANIEDKPATTGTAAKK